MPGPLLSKRGVICFVNHFQNNFSGIKPGVDFENETALIDNGVLDSLDIIKLVGQISDEFDVEVEVTDLVPANFNSAKAMYAMIQRLEDED